MSIELRNQLQLLSNRVSNLERENQEVRAQLSQLLSPQKPREILTLPKKNAEAH